MKVVLNDEERIRLLNDITYNLYIILENKGISQSADKFNDYVNFLDEHTDISRARLKKILTYDIKKLITIKDIDILASALDVEPAELFKRHHS